jgi:hypothetical protein
MALQHLFALLPPVALRRLEEGGFTPDEAERCAEMVDGDADLRGFVDVLLKGCDPVSTELTVDLVWLIVVEARRMSVGLKRRRLLRDPVELAGAFLDRHSAMLGAHRHKIELLRNISGVSRPSGPRSSPWCRSGQGQVHARTTCFPHV